MQMSKFALNLVQYVLVEVVLSETLMIGKEKKAILDYRYRMVSWCCAGTGTATGLRRRPTLGDRLP